MPPPLPPKPLGIVLLGTVAPAVTVEIFIDLACPFSRKVVSTLGNGGADKWRGQSVDFVAHVVPQPWHPQSCVLAEAVLAAQKAGGDAAAWRFMNAVADNCALFTDVATKDKTRHDLYRALAGLASGVGEGGSAVDILPLLLIGEESNNAVTQMLKFQVKYHRNRGIHVTPTVLVNGLEAPDVSSSWTAVQWAEKLAGLGIAA